MKKISCITVVVVLMAMNAQGQRRDSMRMADHGHEFGGRLYGIPNLTDDQKTKIKALNTPLAKETLPLTNQLAEKKVHLRTLQTAEKVDMNAINSTIDEIAQLQSQLEKKRAAHTQAVRKILNDEQRIAFDTRRGEKRFDRFHEPRMKRFHDRNE